MRSNELKDGLYSGDVIVLLQQVCCMERVEKPICVVEFTCCTCVTDAMAARACSRAPAHNIFIYEANPSPFTSMSANVHHAGHSIHRGARTTPRPAHERTTVHT